MNNPTIKAILARNEFDVDKAIQYCRYIATDAGNENVRKEYLLYASILQDGRDNYDSA